MDDLEFYKNLPKLELHAHLNGSLSNKTLEELYNIKDNATKQSHWKAIIDHGDSRTLSECFQIFDLVYSVTDTAEIVYKITKDVISDFYEDGVIYLEIRTTPRAVENKMTKSDYLNSVIEAIKESEVRHPKIIVKLLISLNRKHSRESSTENFNLAIEYFKRHPEFVVGIDVSGDPTHGSWFESLMLKARENGLKISMHCAEIPNIAETKDILRFSPDRIGHGTCIHKDYGGSEELWNFLLNCRIPVECCLSSNVKTRTVRSYKDHHFKYLWENNHPIAICTDDKGVFSTTLSEEYKLTAKHFNLSRKDLWQITLDSIDYSFCSEKQKTHLRNVLQEWKNTHTDSF